MEQPRRIYIDFNVLGSADTRELAPFTKELICDLKVHKFHISIVSDLPVNVVETVFAAQGLMGLNFVYTTPYLALHISKNCHQFTSAANLVNHIERNHL